MNAKKAILALVVVLLGFWMFTDPNGLADAATAGVGKTAELAQQLLAAIVDFVGALT